MEQNQQRILLWSTITQAYSQIILPIRTYDWIGEAHAGYERDDDTLSSLQKSEAINQAQNPQYPPNKTHSNIWELPGNYPVFTVVMVIYHYLDINCPQIFL